MLHKQKDHDNGAEDKAGTIVWLKKLWNYLTPERVQAGAAVIMALVTAWTLVLTPLGERLVSEINRTVRETQAELEQQRTLAVKVTLGALWKVTDDRLAENEYFAGIAADYRAHTKWIEQCDERVTELKDLRMKVQAGQEKEERWVKRKNSSWPLPPHSWLILPQRPDRENTGMLPLDEESRWGERVAEIFDLWMELDSPQEDGQLAYQKLRRKLELLLDTHFRGDGHGAPQTGTVLIEELKTNEVVTQLGTIGSELLRQTFDRFLRVNPELASVTIRVQFQGSYPEHQVVEMGKQIANNVIRFRHAFKSFVKEECGPYF